MGGGFICDMIYKKRQLLKHYKNSFVYIQLLYTTIHGTGFMYTKLFFRCFNSDPFHKSSTELVAFANQVTIYQRVYSRQGLYYSVA